MAQSIFEKSLSQFRSRTVEILLKIYDVLFLWKMGCSHHYLFLLSHISPTHLILPGVRPCSKPSQEKITRNTKTHLKGNRQYTCPETNIIEALLK